MKQFCHLELLSYFYQVFQTLNLPGKKRPYKLQSKLTNTKYSSVLYVLQNDESEKQDEEWIL